VKVEGMRMDLVLFKVDDLLITWTRVGPHSSSLSLCSAGDTDDAVAFVLNLSLTTQRTRCPN